MDQGYRSYHLYRDVCMDHVGPGYGSIWIVVLHFEPQPYGRRFSSKFNCNSKLLMIGGVTTCQECESWVHSQRYGWKQTNRTSQKPTSHYPEVENSQQLLDSNFFGEYGCQQLQNCFLLSLRQESCAPVAGHSHQIQNCICVHYLLRCCETKAMVEGVESAKARKDKSERHRCTKQLLSELAI